MLPNLPLSRGLLASLGSITVGFALVLYSQRSTTQERARRRGNPCVSRLGTLQIPPSQPAKSRGLENNKQRDSWQLLYILTQNSQPPFFGPNPSRNASTNRPVPSHRSLASVQHILRSVWVASKDKKDPILKSCMETAGPMSNLSSRSSVLTVDRFRKNVLSCSFRVV